MTNVPNMPPPEYLAKWDERIVLLQKRVADLLHTLHRVSGHAQSSDASEDIEDAQSDLRAIYKIATEAIATDLKTKTDGEKK